LSLSISNSDNYNRSQYMIEPQGRENLRFAQMSFKRSMASVM
jgi:hypothetical protein